MRSACRHEESERALKPADSLGFAEPRPGVGMDQFVNGPSRVAQSFQVGGQGAMAHERQGKSSESDGAEHGKGKSAIGADQD